MRRSLARASVTLAAIALGACGSPAPVRSSATIATQTSTLPRRPDIEPSFGAPIVLHEIARKVTASQLGFPAIVFAPDGGVMLGRRAHGEWSLEPGGHIAASAEVRDLEFSPEGHRLLVRAAGSSSFDILQVPSLERVAHLDGTAPRWISAHRVAFVDAAGRITRTDDDGAHRTKGLATGCAGLPLRRSAGECRAAFATETDALVYSMEWGVPHELRRVSERGSSDLLAELARGDALRRVSSFRLGESGVLCVSRDTREPATVPPKPRSAPTEIACAAAPWDHFDVVMRGDYYHPDMQLVGDVVLVSFIEEPSRRVYNSSPDEPRTHCIVRRDTHVARCSTDERFAMEWTMLSDERTVIVASNPPRWPRPFVIDLEQQTFAPLVKTAGEYQSVTSTRGRVDRFAMGLDGSNGEGDRVMVQFQLDR